jgi:hypothetical protein
MTWFIRSDAPYLEKLQSSNPNQSNIKGWNWKKKKLYKKIKKIEIKKIRIKIEKKLIFDLRLKLKRKIHIVKGPKKIKRIRIKIDIKNKNNILIKGWNWKE